MTRRDLDVVVVGNAGVDTNVYFHGPWDPSLESAFTEDLDCVGQAGGYCSRGYARLGLRTAYLGALGDDALGRYVRDVFAADGVDLSGVFVDPLGTCRSVNLMNADGTRRNFYDGKDHLRTGPDPARAAALLGRARLVHFHLPDWARRLLPLAIEAGAVVATDLQDVVDPADPYRRDFVEASDVLFFSCVNHADPEPLLRRFLEGARCRLAVAGMGAAGCAVATREGGVQRHPAVTLDAPVRDTNGAGDSLAVGLLASLVLDGLPLEEAVLRGQIAARHACTLRGTSDGLIDRALLETAAGTR